MDIVKFNMHEHGARVRDLEDNIREFNTKDSKFR